MGIVQPNTISYFGGVMLLNLGIPIVFATLAQLSVITANELDLSIGSFVSLVACIAGPCCKPRHAPHGDPRFSSDSVRMYPYKQNTTVLVRRQIDR
jgi:ribose/xylose/arabinose/galactoside ABC-type transport system permease subunit